MADAEIHVQTADSQQMEMQEEEQRLIYTIIHANKDANLAEGETSDI